MIPAGPLDVAFIGRFTCGRCGWWGDPQTWRASWATLDCPRCGESGCCEIPDPNPAPISISTAGDCPSGLQPEERSPELYAAGIRGELLYVLADLTDRVTALEVRR